MNVSRRNPGGAPSILNRRTPSSVLKTWRTSHRVMPGLIDSIFSRICLNQAAWSCMHKSELADCAGRKEAEPPTTMIETNKSTKSRRIIVCPPFAGNVSNLGLMDPTRLKIVDVSL